MTPPAVPSTLRDLRPCNDKKHPGGARVPEPAASGSNPNPVGSMARPKWTFVVRTDDRTGHRQIEVSRLAARAGMVLALLLIAALGSAGFRFLGLVGQGAREHRLERANSLLKAEIAALEQQIDTLRHSLAGLEAQDEYYRLLAGLTPMQPDVREVGIGGPGLETVESNPLYGFDTDLADRAHGTSEEIDRLVRRARLLSFSWTEARDTLSARLDMLASMPSILPTRGYISSGFSSSRYHPILSRPLPHLGLDIVAGTGTPIVAPAKGRVKFVGRNSGYGLMVEIDHGHGIVTRFAHASKTLVRRGQPVERGDPIAEVGMTGLAVAPHLHYEVWVEGRPTNPRRFLFEPASLPD